MFLATDTEDTGDPHETGKIIRVGLKYGDITTVLNIPNTRPYDLTFDPYEQALYWIDLYESNINVVHFSKNGTAMPQLTPFLNATHRKYFMCVFAIIFSLFSNKSNGFHFLLE